MATYVTSDFSINLRIRDACGMAVLGLWKSHALNLIFAVCGMRELEGYRAVYSPTMQLSVENSFVERRLVDRYFVLKLLCVRARNARCAQVPDIHSVWYVESLYFAYGTYSYLSIETELSRSTRTIANPRSSAVRSCKIF